MSLFHDRDHEPVFLRLLIGIAVLLGVGQHCLPSRRCR